MPGFHGTDLVGEEHIPPAAKAGLIIVHGMAEHRGRYADAVRRFTNERIACFTFDLRGHGQSPGERTDIASFQLFLDDLMAIRNDVAKHNPALPLFIWGHSLGSLITIRCVEQHYEGLAGVITSGCPIAAFPRTPSLIREALIALCTPFSRLRVDPRLPAERLSHSEAVQASYRADPLVPKDVTVRLLIEIEAACRRALEEARTINVPWLALHGGDDRIAPPQGSEKLVAALRSADKQLEIYPGMRHEVHNEIEPAASGFYARVIHWIKAHTR
ncbi:MAG TPA: alpha/beta hydrolase [Steroidobacteraceae bacterium]|jgi:alpha-beta hydrolase superfamily lysophospholipase|nr:alpha/beta hydrolase [Steroidobacteraceae bacterium]